MKGLPKGYSLAGLLGTARRFWDVFDTLCLGCFAVTPLRTDSATPINLVVVFCHFPILMP